MELNIITSDPQKLHDEIIKLVESRKLETWEINHHKEVKYLKHTEQWGKKGVIKLSPQRNNKLLVTVLKYTDSTDALRDFEGYYYGRFVEILFVHFQIKFTSIEIV